MANNGYLWAREQYAAVGVDTDGAMAALGAIPISLHCWQGDDVAGFEKDTAGMGGGGIQATGNYPGRARNADELRRDLDKALSLIPSGAGAKRVNLHAIYADYAGKAVSRDELGPEHFFRWIDWAKQNNVGLDFNPTFFAHPLAADGFTLSSRDKAKRQFWIRHGIACRRIGEAFGTALRQHTGPCVTNFWVPDGYKDTPIDRLGPREILERSLDEIFAAPIDPAHNFDAVEGKLFGIGSESYVVGSHEFYYGYALKRGKLLCLDAGHYHPTESLADKISAVLLFLKQILLHVSRGVRWDSDHVVILSDDLRAIAEELVRGDFLAPPARVRIGLDFFDASINRIAAWVIGTRCMQKALLIALLEPAEKMRELELAGDFTSRLALLELSKMLPAGPVWDEYCRISGVPPGAAWLEEIKTYEKDVLAQRG